MVPYRFRGWLLHATTGVLRNERRLAVPKERFLQRLFTKPGVDSLYEPQHLNSI